METLSVSFLGKKRRIVSKKGKTTDKKRKNVII